MFNIHPRKQVSPHLRGAVKPYRYLKPSGQPIRLKQHKGTFSLSNQVVWNPLNNSILEYMTVKGIRSPLGFRQGYIYNNYKYTSVEQFGLKAWRIKV